MYNDDYREKIMTLLDSLSDNPAKSALTALVIEVCCEFGYSKYWYRKTFTLVKSLKEKGN